MHGDPIGGRSLRGLSTTINHHCRRDDAAIAAKAQEKEKDDMRSEVRRKLDMAGSVRAFGRANPATDPRHQATEAKFEERLARAEVLVARQREGQLASKAAHAQRRQLRRELTDRYVRHLVSVAELAGKASPGSFGEFRVPRLNGPNLAFATAMRSMLTTAKEGGELLAQHGLGDGLLADLEKALGAFDRLNTAVLEAKRGHVGATKELLTLSAELVDLVGVLDGINRYRFAGSPEALGAWNSARNVVASPTRAKADPPPAEGGNAIAA